MGSVAYFDKHSVRIKVCKIAYNIDYDFMIMCDSWMLPFLSLAHYLWFSSVHAFTFHASLHVLLVTDFLTTLLGSSLILFAMSFTLHIASTLYLPNSLWFLQKYIKLDQKSWKSAQTSRHVNPMAASFHAFCLLPQHSDRSSWHNIFCRMEHAKQSRYKRWWWSEKKTIYRNLRVMLLY